MNYEEELSKLREYNQSVIKSAEDDVDVVWCWYKLELTGTIKETLRSLESGPAQEVRLSSQFTLSNLVAEQTCQCYELPCGLGAYENGKATITAVAGSSRSDFRVCISRPIKKCKIGPRGYDSNCASFKKERLDGNIVLPVDTENGPCGRNTQPIGKGCENRLLVELSDLFLPTNEDNSDKCPAKSLNDSYEFTVDQDPLEDLPLVGGLFGRYRTRPAPTKGECMYNGLIRLRWNFKSDGSGNYSISVGQEIGCSTRKCKDKGTQGGDRWHGKVYPDSSYLSGKLDLTQQLCCGECSNPATGGAYGALLPFVPEEVESDSFGEKDGPDFVINVRDTLFGGFTPGVVDDASMIVIKRGILNNLIGKGIIPSEDELDCSYVKKQGECQ